MSESTRSLCRRSRTRAGSSTRRARNRRPRSSSAPSPSMARTTRWPSRRRQRDQDEPGVHQLAQAGGDELEHPSDVDLGDERARDLVQRLELLQPAGRRLVEPCVLDRDRGLGGKQRHELLVLVRERSSVRLLGQVQVSERDPAQEDRNTEERPHRRVVRREPDRARVRVRDRRGGAASRPRSARRGRRGRAEGRRSRPASRRRSR